MEYDIFQDGRSVPSWYTKYLSLPKDTLRNYPENFHFLRFVFLWITNAPGLIEVWVQITYS